MVIVSFGQAVDLERAGEMTHRFTVLLGDGSRQDVITTEDTIQQLASILVGSVLSAEIEETELPEPQPHVYGDPGEVYADTEDPDDEDVVRTAPTPKPSPVLRPSPRVDSDGFVLPVVARTVPMDEMGYPIVSRKAAVVPNEIVDEDVGEQI